MGAARHLLCSSPDRSMICILHGYLLDGSGSNLWTRSVVEALCREGTTVHLVCQENHPERFPFIAEAIRYPPGGSPETFLHRDTPYPGRCILHKPVLGPILPVYVWDKYEEFTRVVLMTEMSDAEIEAYLARNTEVLQQVLQGHEISVLHANHAVLMSVVAERVARTTGLPFAVMPHGSAIEYAVKPQERFRRLAAGALAAARRVFVIGGEIRTRIRTLFPSVPGLEEKMVELHLGVDTGLFEPVDRASRRGCVTDLANALKEVPRGKTPSQTTALRDSLSGDASLPALKSAMQQAADYAAKRPDAALEDRLAAIDWESDTILLYVGRLISGKGVQSVIAAMPLILEQHPKARLLLVGHGPLREPMEALLWALRHGDSTLLHHVVEWGGTLEDSGEGPLEDLAAFFRQLDQSGRFAGYLEAAQRTLGPNRVVFTGYLTHRELRHLFPCCDLAVFPSIVPEAGPLVFLEALAAGCWPLGTYLAGMAASIDTVAEVLPREDVDWMKLPHQREELVSGIVRTVTGALALGGRHRDRLRDLAVQRYDWKRVARRLIRGLQAV